MRAVALVQGSYRSFNLQHYSSKGCQSWYTISFGIVVVYMPTLCDTYANT